ncbi:hypothetical protein PIIN_09896 [Serendipita indica DSM 11827]|uniref:Uncharacterized protein n=1 Tax=Serendipita indica (strain DSM 11827) TaxID=1109443 RepID=G4TX57_SERID|nr:hypothetical protein PIIN_09896 [Serendipita indica DSM 11827]
MCQPLADSKATLGTRGKMMGSSAGVSKWARPFTKDERRSGRQDTRPSSDDGRELRIKRRYLERRNYFSYTGGVQILFQWAPCTGPGPWPVRRVTSKYRYGQ